MIFITLTEEVSQQIEIRKEMFTNAEPGIRDFFGNLIDERRLNMTKEEVRKELNEATKLQKEATRKVNEALCHAAGQLDKAGSESFETGYKVGYDKGLNDYWEIMRKVYRSPINGGWSALELYDIFGNEIRGNNTYIGGVLTKFTPQEALAKIRAWEEKKEEEERKKKAEEERKKQEEAEKIQIGDVVDCYGQVMVFKGIFFSEEFDHYWVLTKDCSAPQNLNKRDWRLRKTGEHVDILGVLK